MSKKEKKILRSFMMITQISITMLVPIFISGWLGTWLNSSVLVHRSYFRSCCC